MQAYFEYASKTSSLIFTFVLTYLFISVIFPYFAGDMASLDVRTGGLYPHRGHGSHAGLWRRRAIALCVD